MFRRRHRTELNDYQASDLFTLLSAFDIREREREREREGD